MNSLTNSNQNINNSIYNSLSNEQCLILSIVIISKGIININHQTVQTDQTDQTDQTVQITYTKQNNLEQQINNQTDLKDNLAILNITHTDSYRQKIYDRINSLYNQMGASLIFPLVIWKNNISKTLLSTGNINRSINQSFFTDMDKYKLNILVDNIKQNIPKQNYILSEEPIHIFNHLCEYLGMDCIYKTNLIDNFNIDKIFKNIESKYKIKLNNIADKKFSLSYEQIQYFRQYGTTYYSEKKSNKRSRDIYESDSNPEINHSKIQQLELTQEQYPQNQIQEQNKQTQEQNKQIQDKQIITETTSNLESYLSDVDFTIFDD